MKWQDLMLEYCKPGSEWAVLHRRTDIIRALIKQIEENRIAIEILKREQKAHWPPKRDPGDA